MYPEESQTHKLSWKTSLAGSGVGGPNSINSSAEARFSHLPPTNGVGMRRVLGVWHNLWSEAVNTHPPLHKPTQLLNPQSQEGHIHGTSMWGAAEEMSQSIKDPTKCSLDSFLKPCRKAMYVMQHDATDPEFVGRDSAKPASPTPPGDVSGIPTWLDCKLIQQIRCFWGTPTTKKTGRRGSMGCLQDPLSSDIFHLVCLSVTLFLSLPFFLFLSISLWLKLTVK